MKAYVQQEHGRPVEAVELPDPSPQHGEIVVSVASCGLNHLDLWLKQGSTGDDLRLPRVPGSDVVGHVTELGAGVDPALAGKNVVIYPGRGCGGCDWCSSGQPSACRGFRIMGYSFDGGYAEKVVVPAESAMVLGDDPDPAWAAVPVAYVTAWNALVTKGGLEKGKTVAVWGAAGGLGNAALRLAEAMGAIPLPIVGSEEKASWLAATGWSGDIVVRGEDVATRVRSLTGGRGVDMVLDHVGAAAVKSSLRMLAVRGHLAFCGVTTGHLVEMDLRQIFGKQLTVAGTWIGDPSDMRDVVRFLGQNPQALPVVQASYAFDDARAAQDAQADPGRSGKVVLRSSGPAEA